MNRQYFQTGMTLIELMIVLVLLGIIMGVATPGMKQLLAMQQVRASVHDLSADFALARTLAVSRRQVMVVCPAADGQCVDGSEWSRGWMVFTDADGNNQPEHAGEIIAIRQPGKDSLSIRSNNGRPRLRYLPTGTSHGSNLTVNVCFDGQLKAQVVVNNAGRARVERHGQGNTCPM